MEILDELEKFETLIGAIVAFAGLYWNAHINKKNNYLNVFMTYCQRYDNLVCKAPERLKGLHVDELNKINSLTASELDFIDSCYALFAEEYYLKKNGYLAEDLWKIWDPSMSALLNTEAFRKALENDTIQKKYFQHIKGFEDYVNSKQQSQNT